MRRSARLFDAILFGKTGEKISEEVFVSLPGAGLGLFAVGIDVDALGRDQLRRRDAALVVHHPDDLHRALNLSCCVLGNAALGQKPKKDILAKNCY